MSLLRRGELEALPFGSLLVQVLQNLVDQMGTSPQRIGKSRVLSGVGAPSGVVKGSVGDLYLRTDGSTSTVLYVKETGADTLTGWVAK